MELIAISLITEAACTPLCGVDSDTDTRTTYLVLVGAER